VPSILSDSESPLQLMSKRDTVGVSNQRSASDGAKGLRSFPLSNDYTAEYWRYVLFHLVSFRTGIEPNCCSNEALNIALWCTRLLSFEHFPITGRRKHRLSNPSRTVSCNVCAKQATQMLNPLVAAYLVFRCANEHWPQYRGSKGTRGSCWCRPWLLRLLSEELLRRRRLPLLRFFVRHISTIRTQRRCPRTISRTFSRQFFTQLRVFYYFRTT